MIPNPMQNWETTTRKVDPSPINERKVHNGNSVIHTHYTLLHKKTGTKPQTMFNNCKRNPTLTLYKQCKSFSLLDFQTLHFCLVVYINKHYEKYSKAELPQVNCCICSYSIFLVQTHKPMDFMCFVAEGSIRQV